jgi:hypothetical protein
VLRRWGGIKGWVFLAEDLSLKFHGLGFALTGLGPFFVKHSQGIALGLGRKTMASPVGAQ